MVVVRVLARQDAGSARAAQRTGHELREREGARERWKIRDRVGSYVFLGRAKGRMREIHTALEKVIPSAPISFFVFDSGVWREKRGD